jgi:hypothetical protein
VVERSTSGFQKTPLNDPPASHNLGQILKGAVAMKVFFARSATILSGAVLALKAAGTAPDLWPLPPEQ